jgi:uncharacterized protein
MPRLDRDASASGPLIQAFAGNGFRVDGNVFAEGVKLTPVSASHWHAPSLDILAEEHIEDILALTPAPEFLLLGTGSSLRRPSPALIEAVEQRGFGIEIMDSRAAARAWGVLRGEDRWIAAALLPLGEP